MVSEDKKQAVQKLTEQIKASPVIAVVNMENLPAKQLQNMKAQLLKKEVTIQMARKKLLQLALKNSAKPNIDQLIEKIKGMPALLLSKENPFILYKIIQKNKSPAPAKANQTSPKDIIVPAGATNFAPGPIISELAGVGIKTKVDAGKLTIVEDTTVAKEGDTISLKLAEILKRLDIQPMEIGLDLVAAWENEIVFNAQQLFIDEEDYLNNINTAAQESFNLAMEAAYLTTETVEALLQKASREAKTIALEQDFITEETRDEILAKAEGQALAVKEAGKIEAQVQPKEAAQEEKKSEEGNEEPRAEAKAEEKEAAPDSKPEEKKEQLPKTEKKPAEHIEEAPKAETKTPAETEPETPAPEEKKPEPQEQEKQAPSSTMGKKAEQQQEKENKETSEGTKEEPTEKPKEAIPSAIDLIKATKEKYAQEQEQQKPQAPEKSADEMITETRLSFQSPIKEPKITATDLVQEEKNVAKHEEKPKDVKEAENLFEKLKKQGTLREEK